MGEDTELKVTKEDMIEKLMNNLPALRAKLGITQNDLADIIGIGRQTLLSIENRRSRIRWDTFLALVIVFSKANATNEYMKFLGLNLEIVEKIVYKDIVNKKGGYIMKFEKLWTDYDSEYDTVRSICALPVGIKGSACPKCGSKELIGALITPTADEQDPNILCKDCGYWRD